LDEGDEVGFAFDAVNFGFWDSGHGEKGVKSANKNIRCPLITC
jgi:hypothetical protein